MYLSEGFESICQLAVKSVWFKLERHDCVEEYFALLVNRRSSVFLGLDSGSLMIQVCQASNLCMLLVVEIVS